MVAVTAVHRVAGPISLAHQRSWRTRSAAWNALGTGVKRQLTLTSFRIARASVRVEWLLQTTLASGAAKQ